MCFPIRFLLILALVLVLMAACKKRQSVEGSPCQTHHEVALATALQGNEQLDTLVRATIAGGGVLPFIHKSLTAGKAGIKNPDTPA